MGLSTPALVWCIYIHYPEMTTMTLSCTLKRYFYSILFPHLHQRQLQPNWMHCSSRATLRGLTWQSDVSAKRCRRTHLFYFRRRPLRIVSVTCRFRFLDTGRTPVRPSYSSNRLFGFFKFFLIDILSHGTFGRRHWHTYGAILFHMKLVIRWFLERTDI
jgi:hypothetical protein